MAEIKNKKNSEFDLLSWYKENQIEKNKKIDLFFTPLRGNKKNIIRLTNINKSFSKKSKKALDSINLEIRENENVAIVGSNGAGKTTLIEIISGINKPDSGKIEYLFDWNKSPMEKIGIQFQGSSYPNGIKVKKIIDFYISVFECNFRKEEIDSLIMIFGVDDILNKKANALSDGQLQRINALLSIIHKPKIIFLDEISTGLDIATSFRIKKFIKEYSIKSNTSIVLVSHDISEIEYIAERIVVINCGKIVASLYIDEAIKKYGSLEKFLNNYII